MRLRDALIAAMSASRPGRLTPADVERLLTGEPIERGEGVRALLAAAVSAYRVAFHDTGAAPVARRDRTRGRVAVRIAAFGATSAAVLVAGTAFAAGSGRLPDGPQQQAHRVFGFAGVPAPATGSPAAPATSAGSPRPAPSPATHPGTTPDPTATDVVGLCRAWQDARPGQLPADARRLLTLAAGGAERIEQFCTALLNPAATPSAGPDNPSHPEHPSPGPKH